MDVNEATFIDIGPGTIFDIGANHGTYTDRMRLTDHKVYAFEPHPDNIYILNNKFNQCDNVVIVPIALSNFTGETGLFNCSNPGGHSISKIVSEKQQWGHSRESTPVRCMTVDDFVVENNITDLVSMKIDVEGAEEFVFQGAYYTLRNFDLVIALETHQTVDCESIYAMVTEAGYTVFDSSNQVCLQMICDGQYIMRKSYA